MDRKIPEKEIRRRRIKSVLKYGLPSVAAVGAVVWLFLASGEVSVREKVLQFSTVDSGDIEASVFGSGKVVPAFEEVITSPVGSKIVEVCHRPGDVVEPGTPLLVLDLLEASTNCGKLRDQLAMRRLEIEKARANNSTYLTDLEMKIKVGEMNVRRLEVELRNERYLDSIGSGTTDKVRQAEFALRSGELELEQLRKQYVNEQAVRRADISVKQLDIEIIEKELAMAERTLGDAEIRSPRRATVTSITERIGQQVAAGEQVAVVSDLGHYKVAAEIADSYRQSVATGNKANVRIGGKVFGGRVTTVSPTSVNGQIAFTVALDCDSTSELKAGMRPDVFVSRGLREGVLRIANGSYYKTPGEYSLYVLSESDRLEERRVELGEASFDFVEVISGLSPGEKVVVSDMSDYKGRKAVNIKK